MRNSRFIELLNLYVDQQLSREEATELEREIARHPERAKLYQQYCRMQKACTLLFETERIQAPNTGVLAAALRDVDRKVVAFPEAPSQVFRRVSFSVVGLAAAACVALTLNHRLPFVGGTSFALKSFSPAPTSALAVAKDSRGANSNGARVIPISVSTQRRPEYFSVFTPRPSLSTDTANDFVVENQENSRVSYEWMHSVELTPVAPLSDRITLASTATSAPSRGLRSVPATSQTQESAAFEFQR